MGRYVKLLGAKLLLCGSVVRLQRVLGVSGGVGGFYHGSLRLNNLNTLKLISLELYIFI